MTTMDDEQKHKTWLKEKVEEIAIKFGAYVVFPVAVVGSLGLAINYSNVQKELNTKTVFAQLSSVKALPIGNNGNCLLSISFPYKGNIETATNAYRCRDAMIQAGRLEDLMKKGKEVAVSYREVKSFGETPYNELANVYGN